MRKFALIALFLIIAGCGETPEAAIPGSSAAAVSGHMPFELTEEQQEGWVIYETMCWTCHGVSGRGDGPAIETGSSTMPPTFHTLDYARASTESLLRRFRSGSGGSEPTPAHMRYVASIMEPEHFAHALSFVPVLVYPPEIPGSALAGKSIFDDRCAGCHGLSGTGEGTASETFTNVSPADFTADSLITGGDWVGLFRKISDGGSSTHSESMPSWGTVLTENQIWDLVAFVATFQEGVLRPPFWLD
jgi:mono/diheme cytochrome c family protein